MFCPNCGEFIKEDVDLTTGKKEVKVSSVTVDNETINELKLDSAELLSSNEKENVIGLCPYCGKPISEHLDKEEIKKLNQIAHSKVHYARNKFNSGMCGIVIGTLLLLIAAIFLILCFSPQRNGEFGIGEPFYVFVALSILSLVSYVLGVIYLIIAHKYKSRYSRVISEIQNDTFVQ